MNYIRHLTGFFERVAQDDRLNATHISLYIAIFQFWNLNRFRNPISISRDELMRISKISSKATYHKCLKHLHAQQYLRYEPSYNPYRGSHVHLYNFADDMKPDGKSRSASPSKNGLLDSQALDHSNTTAQQDNEQLMVPSINRTNNTNYQTLQNGAATEANQDNARQGKSELKEKKGCAEKKESADDRDLPESSAGFNIPPTLETVTLFFERESFPLLEARKFFNHYASNGWLIGGRSPMVDWMASARNWMINASQFTSGSSLDRAQHLSATIDKNYSEPL